MHIAFLQQLAVDGLACAAFEQYVVGHDAAARPFCLSRVSHVGCCCVVCLWWVCCCFARQCRALCDHLQEQQIGELLDVVAIRHAIVVAVVPELLDDGRRSCEIPFLNRLGYKDPFEFFMRDFGNTLGEPRSTPSCSSHAWESGCSIC